MFLSYTIYSKMIYGWKKLSIKVESEKDEKKY